MYFFLSKFIKIIFNKIYTPKYNSNINYQYFAKKDKKRDMIQIVNIKVTFG